jgi:hypothetical protein
VNQRPNVCSHRGYGLALGLCAILPSGNYLPHTLGPDRYATGMGLFLLLLATVPESA